MHVGMAYDVSLLTVSTAAHHRSMGLGVHTARCLCSSGVTCDVPEIETAGPDSPSLLHICSEGLFAQNALAHAQGSGGPLAVQAVWQPHVHGINVRIIQQLRVRPVRLWDPGSTAGGLSACQTSMRSMASASHSDASDSSTTGARLNVAVLPTHLWCVANS